MQFLEVGDQFINLDFVTDVQVLNDGSLTISFAVQEFQHARVLRIGADQAGPLLAWLRMNAERVLSAVAGSTATVAPAGGDQARSTADDEGLAWTEQ